MNCVCAHFTLSVRFIMNSEECAPNPALQKVVFFSLCYANDSTNAVSTTTRLFFLFSGPSFSVIKKTYKAWLMYIHRTHTQVDEAQSLVNVKRRNECVFKKRNTKTHTHTVYWFRLEHALFFVRLETINRLKKTKNRHSFKYPGVSRSGFCRYYLGQSQSDWVNSCNFLTDLVTCHSLI
jgi:hypothetical protein